MDVACGACGAELRLNPNLGGTTVSCPQCGAPVPVPKAAPRREAAERPSAPRRFGPRYTLWLLGAQAALGALALSCFAGAFHRAWDKPQWSYLKESPLALAGAGVFFCAAIWAAYHVPVLATLAAALAALAACAWRFSEAGSVDVSRALALAVAMLALWLALSHRRAAR